MSLETKNFTFGDFLLDKKEKTLFRSGEKIPLTPKAFELLVVLVENHSRLVEKSDLMNRVWADSFVEEGNLAYTMRLLRKALGDEAQQPEFIETVPRRGYRFIAAVEKIGVEKKTANKISEQSLSGNGNSEIFLPNDNEKAEKPGRFLKILASALAVLLIAFSAVGIWYAGGAGFSQGPPVLDAAFASEKISTSGDVYNAAISPDGKTVVYVNGSGGKPQSVWIRQIESGNNVQIIPESADGYGGLAFSPDGNFIYFTRVPLRSERQFDVYRVSIFGGIPNKITSETQGWINVSPDGGKISFVRCYYQREESCSLWIADSNGANERKIASRPPPFRIADNDFSPDGRSVAFAAGQSENAANDFGLFEVNLETGAERELSAEKFFNIKNLAWLPAGGGLLITASRIPNKNFRVWRVALPSGEAVPLTQDAETYSILSLDRAGERLISTNVKPDFKLYLLDLDDPTRRTALIDASSASFAPDGSIVFSSSISGNDEVWRMKPDKSARTQLTNDPADEFAPVISKKDGTIYFASNRTGAAQIRRMNGDGSDGREIPTSGGVFPLAVSPDGGWIYFQHSLDRTLRRIASDGSREETVWDKPAFRFVFSPDAKKFVFVERSGAGRTLKIVSTADGKTLQTFQPALPDKRMPEIAFSPDGGGVYYLLRDDEAENYALYFQPLAGGKARKITDLGGGEISEAPNFSVSPDGKSLIYVQGGWRHDAVLLSGLK